MAGAPNTERDQTRDSHSLPMTQVQIFYPWHKAEFLGSHSLLGWPPGDAIINKQGGKTYLLSPGLSQHPLATFSKTSIYLFERWKEREKGRLRKRDRE